MKTTYTIIFLALVLLAAKEIFQTKNNLIYQKNSATLPLTPTSPIENHSTNNIQALALADINTQNNIKVIHLDTPKTLKAFYVTYYSFESIGKLNQIILAAQRNGINSLVVDIRSSNGGIFDFSDNKIKTILSQLHDKGFYLIARIVSFKMNENEPNSPWYDPSSKDRWNQIAEVSKEAIDLGFDEINYDYVRYGGPDEAQSQTPIEQREPVIKSFFEFLNTEVRQKYGRPISADIFGTTFVDPEKGIGQNPKDAFENFDYVMPMTYPSHWAIGSLGIKDPGNHPYQIVYQSLEKGLSKIKNDPLKIAGLRCWVQAFDIESISPWKLRVYTAQDIQDQIKACDDAGGVGWALWNGFSNYKDFAGVAPSPTSVPPIISTTTASTTLKNKILKTETSTSTTTEKISH